MRFKTTVLFLFIGIFIGCTKEPVEDKSITSKDLKEQIAIRILYKTNLIRSSQGLDDLLQDDEMDVLASLHSENMITHDFFDHVDHKGKSPSERADDLDFVWSSIAENIGYVPWFENVSGCGDTRSAEAIAECVVEGWRNSPGHYANIIGNYNELGVGVAFTQDSVAYFTQVFRIR
ncbi:MAG: hypothetical protein CBC08_04415 [Flavobacteriaceae bacterium TMED48]|jgi:uncharacterized protein YkwD|nr:MAG: hypothetical protein CBC08_04415 [Flavobacteriaceae bacterium TMED48]